MPGRQLLDESECVDPRYGLAHPELAKRRKVLRQTLERFQSADPPSKYQTLAQTNLRRWREATIQEQKTLVVDVIAGDWGEVTHAMTVRYGHCFAALNMANAYVPGGAYVEGAPAQEENMFRRTDCHFSIGPEEYDATIDQYHPHMTSLLSAEQGRVYLDSEKPRVCIRGPEDLDRSDLGYAWLPDEDVFPFYELRSAAQDLRGGSVFSEANARQRIGAQLDTLIDQQIRYAVLGASGCGAFMNPTTQIATIYRDEIRKRQTEFKVVVFAIFHPGYGADNVGPFRSVFAAWPDSNRSTTSFSNAKVPSVTRENLHSSTTELATAVVSNWRWAVDDLYVTILGMVLYGFAEETATKSNLTKEDAHAAVLQAIMQSVGAAEKWSTGLVDEARQSAEDPDYHPGQNDLVTVGRSYVGVADTRAIVENVFANIANVRKNAGLPEAELPVFLNPLAMLLTGREKEKGAPLTEEEVIAVRDEAQCMMMTLSQAERFYNSLDSKVPMARLDPNNIWEQWQAYRVAVDGQSEA